MPFFVPFLASKPAASSVRAVCHRPIFFPCQVRVEVRRSSGVPGSLVNVDQGPAAFLHQAVAGRDAAQFQQFAASALYSADTSSGPEGIAVLLARVGLPCRRRRTSWRSRSPAIVCDVSALAAEMSSRKRTLRTVCLPRLSRLTAVPTWHALLYADGETADRKDRFAGPPVGGVLRDLPVAVQVHQSNIAVETRPASACRMTTKDGSPSPGMVGYERHHALAGHFGDSPLGQPEEADIQVVQVELLDSPAALRRSGCSALPCTVPRAPVLLRGLRRRRRCTADCPG